MTDTATLGTAEDEAPGDGAFVEPAAMEDDLGELFPGDRGVLDPAVRRVLVHLLQRRFVLADRNREEWTALLDNQQLVESRLNDLFVRLVIDHDRGVAYKQQVRSDELDVPILLRDAAYTRSETLVLVHLRTVYQRESAAGEPAARVDIEDVEQTVMSYFADAEGDTAKRQRLIRKAMDRLARDGIVDEETTGRFRISPLVEIVLSAEKLRELREWLRDRSGADDTGGITAEEDEEGDDEPQEEEL
ncbi:DUF4194 domain-containing protein [Microbacterium sp. Yaish 1]|uniref:DUF4194 domain-containing protein n=1 Tax=Microbacterium sp. Yaish 1 TaxID=2025014 RepID=UPI000B9463B6|nr:DUF4194 domain-containing protein [Microbacterium sp. Yaish 1]OYC98197.1 hypothetical protein CI089_06800 [Microbacterium sp. Yaish 1]